MSKQGSLSSVPTEGGQDRYSEPSIEARRAPRGRRRRERRFEIGFFLRKTVNGWLAYYKIFPPSTRQPSEQQAAQPVMKAAAAGTAPAAEDDLTGGSGGVLRSTTHPPMNDDPGPGTQTRYEAGMFLRVVEEGGSSEEDDET